MTVEDAIEPEDDIGLLAIDLGQPHRRVKTSGDAQQSSHKLLLSYHMYLHASI
ncbi:MAG: hypothetical protein ACP5HZ_02980 [Ferrimicrobium sp.]|uniref:hypothetical protein n=1 Tax=Ferrimicrobium sp. TaxID=2926050 RepID=UPI00260DE192|nr:hypothetical protein [Ferrimicrobium sp.]